MDRVSTTSLTWWFYAGCLVVFGLFGVAIFAQPPYSVIALCLVPLPFAALMVAWVVRLRRVVALIRASRRP